ncbi:class I SAM-dependent methyltransferase [Bdellovibrio sp. HCB274]|uniref:class I SAM-dependent methyltransferase n=1 Tax=Bdellovibrio sp. HCB274 TaxID=3394361 RepID=UPI0039B66DD1
MSENRYYFQHEIAYQQIRQNNGVGWQKKTLSDFRCTNTEAILDSLVTKHFPQTESKTALDLGCGGGSTAHYFADLGFTTSGIDISPTAIELAKEMAAKLGRNISFEVGDVVELEQRKQSYDLIYDSHCIHCIVLEEDRSRLYKAIASALRPGGIFIIDTMAYRETAAMCANPEPLRFDNDYILWHKTKNNSLAGVTEYNGELWCPQRRVYPVDTLLKELCAAGLQTIETAIEDQGPEKTYMLRAVCKTKT